MYGEEKGEYTEAYKVMGLLHLLLMRHFRYLVRSAALILPAQWTIVDCREDFAGQGSQTLYAASFGAKTDFHVRRSKAVKSSCQVVLHTGGLETVAQEIERILAR